jgi:predicted porin
MKKTLLVSAIAATVMSTSVFAVEKPAIQAAENLDSMPVVFGNIQLKYDIKNVEAVPASQSYGLKDGGSILGFKHSHDIMPGVKGFYLAEFGWNVDGSPQADTRNFDLYKGYIGAEGDFGKVWAGTDNTAYEDVDVLNTYEQVGVSGDLAKQTRSNTIHYQTKDISGLTVNTTVTMKSKTTEDYEFSTSATYVMGNTTLIGAVSMNSNADKYGYYATGSAAQKAAVGANKNGHHVFGVAFKQSLGDILVVGQMEYQKENQLLVGTKATFTMGANLFNAGLSYSDDKAPGATDTTTSFSVGSKHLLSKFMYVYVEGMYSAKDSGTSSKPDSNTSEMVLGATYLF